MFSLSRVHHRSDTRKSPPLPLILLAVGLMTGFLTSPLSLARDFALPAKHQHLKGSCRGQLIFGEQGVRYETSFAKDRHQWTFDDIQEIQFIGKKQLNLVSYEGSRARFGGDRIFKFELINEDIPNEFVAFVNSHFSKPISDRLGLRATAARFEMPVKHLHRVGGCQGKLTIGDNEISFDSDRPGESRRWRYSDLQSIGTSGPYDLRLTTFEHGPLQYGDTKEFRFHLKEKLDEHAYRFAWTRINELPISRQENGRLGQ
jgi:hypothetical protein